MANESSLHAPLRIPRLLEGEDDQHAVHISLDLLHPTRPRGPHLRADVVADVIARRPRPLRNAKVETGIVNQHQPVRFVSRNVFPTHFFVAQDGRQVLHDLHHAHEGQLAVVLHDRRSGLRHQISAPGPELRRRILRPDGTDEVGAVEVAAGLAGD